MLTDADPMASAGSESPAHPHGGRLSEILEAIAADPVRDRVSIADLVSILSHRAFGALMLVFSLPNALPMPPGTSTILGAPLLFLAAQLALNRPAPWLPGFIASRSMSRSDFGKLVAKVSPWLARAERLLRPRASFLTRPPFEQGIGLFSLILAIVLFLPIPLGNMLPAFAISILSLAILERDGLAAIFGFLTGILSLVIVSGVIYGFVLAGLFLIRRMLGV